jgi:branched-chain amino acid transport system permease protein
VRPVPVKLTAFTISGTVAGIAGGLYVHLTQSFDIVTFGPGASLDVFTSGVVGGLGSLFGGVLGAIFLRGSQWFITDPAWQFLSSAVGVLLVLLILPGGLASLVIKLRDRLVRYILGRESGNDEPPVSDGVTVLDRIDVGPTDSDVPHREVASLNGGASSNGAEPSTERDETTNVTAERGAT